LLVRQGQLNAALDLDKSDAQAAEPVAPDAEPVAVHSRSGPITRTTQGNSPARARESPGLNHSEESAT